jgi:ABC-type phosphate transport system auxiliary subunit
MLTAEQTRLRIQDSEMRVLRAENERLQQKIKDMRGAVKDIALAYAEKLPYSYKMKIIEMVKKLDVPNE